MPNPFAAKWKYPARSVTYRKTYKAWNNMNRRCYREADPAYESYGGRGIRVCDRWRLDFDAFVEDMGIAPPALTLERNDVNGDYTPENCRWATRKEQANNTRSNIMITLNGKTQSVTLWAEELGMPPSRLHARLKSWPIGRALDPEQITAPHGEIGRAHV